jgi:hypothetical protein
VRNKEKEQELKRRAEREGRTALHSFWGVKRRDYLTSPTRARDPFPQHVAADDATYQRIVQTFAERFKEWGSIYENYAEMERPGPQNSYRSSRHAVIGMHRNSRCRGRIRSGNPSCDSMWVVVSVWDCAEVCGELASEILRFAQDDNRRMERQVILAYAKRST